MGNENSKSDWWVDIPLAWTLIATNWFVAWPTVGVWFYIFGYQQEWVDFFYGDICLSMDVSGDSFIDWF